MLGNLTAIAAEEAMFFTNRFMNEENKKKSIGKCARNIYE